MRRPLKLLYSPRYVKSVADAVAAQSRDFDAAVFTAAVLGRGWGGLELKQRVRRISSMLHAHLPGEYLGQLGTLKRVAPGFDGFLATFFPDFVEVHGLDHFDASTHALQHFTQFSSSELAVRPFIVRYGERMMRVMRRWSRHESEHVRRLASEGCRPRLPWAMALPEFKRDPAPILPILEQLRTDPSEYVRRSVANNLNDIAKDHPDLVLGIAARWLGASPETDKLVKHACRTLLKKGDQQALRLFGHHDDVAVVVKGLRASETVEIGSTLDFAFVVSSDAATPARIEYAIDFVKRAGGTSRKVFKIAEKDLAAKTPLRFERHHRFTDFTTRTHFPGRHRVTIVVNGVARATREFLVTVRLEKRGGR